MADVRGPAAVGSGAVAFFSTLQVAVQANIPLILSGLFSMGLAITTSAFTHIVMRKMDEGRIAKAQRIEYLREIAEQEEERSASATEMPLSLLANARPLSSPAYLALYRPSDDWAVQELVRAAPILQRATNAMNVAWSDLGTSYRKTVDDIASRLRHISVSAVAEGEARWVADHAAQIMVTEAALRSEGFRPQDPLIRKSTGGAYELLWHSFELARCSVEDARSLEKAMRAELERPELTAELEVMRRHSRSYFAALREFGQGLQQFRAGQFD